MFHSDDGMARPDLAHYELRPGWHQPIERFELSDERGFALRWYQVCRDKDAGCWVIDANGDRRGTVTDVKTDERTLPPLARGVYVPTFCVECGHEFWTTTHWADVLCPGCVIGVRPGEAFTMTPAPAFCYNREPHKYSPVGFCYRCGCRQPKG